MTTPRVTVPVEDLAGKLKAIRDKFLMPTPDKDFTDYAVMTRCIDALSAAPAPEGGAVEATERLAWLSEINGSCPGWVVVNQNDLRIVLSALRAQPPALTAAFMTRAKHLLDLAEKAEDDAIDGDEGCVWPVEALRIAYTDLSALATREEAPAEVGEREAIARIIDPEAWGKRDRQEAEISATSWLDGGKAARATLPDDEPSLAKADAILALRAQPPSREEDGGTLDPAFVAWLKERDCLPNDDDGTIEWADIICALNDWEADLTPAREDAQPVAWRYRFVTSTDGKDWSDWFLVHGRDYIPTRENQTIQPLYTTPPAPEAEKLRVALHLFRAFVQRNVGQWAMGAGDHGHPIWALVAEALGDAHGAEVRDGPEYRFIQPENRQALDALQQDAAPGEAGE